MSERATVNEFSGFATYYLHGAVKSDTIDIDSVKGRKRTTLLYFLLIPIVAFIAVKSFTSHSASITWSHLGWVVK
jgi:hypothetical protein